MALRADLSTASSQQYDTLKHVAKTENGILGACQSHEGRDPEDSVATEPRERGARVPPEMCCTSASLPHRVCPTALVRHSPVLTYSSHKETSS